jgi:uncharacterized protein YkwD
LTPALTGTAKTSRIFDPLQGIIGGPALAGSAASMRAISPSGVLLLLTLLAAPSLAAAQGSPEAALLARINELRAGAGLSPLLEDPRLDAAAASHTVEMAARGELFHVSETSGTPIDRARAAGIESTDLAENVAMHGTLEDAQASLEASEAHLANMLGPRATHVGLSVVAAGGGVYVTQLFAHLDAGSAPVPSEPAPSAPAAAPLAAPPAASSAGAALPGGAVVVPPDPSGVVRVPAPAPGVTGYWVCAASRTGSRWYYYPVRPGMTGALAADLSVSGPPPGYAPESCGGTGTSAGARAAVPPGSRSYGTSPRGPDGASRTIITPWGTLRVETRPR